MRFRYICQVREISSIRQPVKVDDSIVCVVPQPISDKVGADKSSTTRNQ
jgi:hypothetical protein